MFKIDIVGNIKIMSPLRLKYFLAVMKSVECLKDVSGIYINIENGKHLINPLTKFLKNLGFKTIFLSCEKGKYGELYCSLINRTTSEYILNIEDDHFFMPNDFSKLEKLIETASTLKTEIIPTTFFKMLTKRYSVLSPAFENEYCKNFDYNSTAFDLMGDTENDIVVGNNCIFSRTFALRHWGMGHGGPRPHPFEEKRKNLKEEHLQLMMPKFEILRPVDDNHGVDSSCCLDNPNEKWNDVFKSISLVPFLPWILHFRYKKLLK